MSRILVIGSSGNVGSHLSALLREKGHDVVRATSRAPTAPDQRRLDLATREGLSAALEGVRRAFVLAPPGMLETDTLLGPFIARAKELQLEKVVLMTALGANADPSIPMRKAELLLENAGIPWNVIRPNWFMQNFESYWVHDINTLGRIRLPTGKAKGSFIDVRDIAAVAAALLDQGRFTDTELDLTGGRALDHDEVAAILSEETGRDIRYEDVTPETLLQNLRAGGVPLEYAEHLVKILGFFKAGYVEQVTDAVSRITGKAPIPFEQYAHESRGRWAVRAGAS